MDHVNIAAEFFCDVVGPVDHWRHEFTGWQRDTNDCGRRQLTSLDDGVCKLRGADHHGLDSVVFNPAVA